jgi:hypothetical protein
MIDNSQTIEVEVIEVDGVVPTDKFEPQTEAPPRRRPWQDLGGRVRKLDRRWWPLWIFLGIIAAVIVLTLGLVVGVVVVIYRILRGLFRAIFG